MSEMLFRGGEVARRRHLGCWRCDSTQMMMMMMFVVILLVADAVHRPSSIALQCNVISIISSLSKTPSTRYSVGRQSAS